MITHAADHGLRLPSDPSQGSYRRLRAANVVMAVLHAVQAAIVLALGDEFDLEVGALVLGGPPGTSLEEAGVERLAAVLLAPAVAAFLATSAVFHALIAGPLWRRYRDELDRERNRIRWVEYAISATLMIVLIALVTGVVDIAALVAIGFANVAMLLFGWLMEVGNEKDRTKTWWSPFVFGCVAGVGPWVAIAVSLSVGVQRSDADPPGFVWAILVSLFVFFNCFALNQWLQYRRSGPWRRYAFGEAAYVMLSLTAKSALAWQIFANTLVE
jgi:hypothetical protein